MPPFFEHNSEEEDLLIEKAISINFPKLPVNMKLLGEFFIASLVFHSTFLKRTLPKEHILFSCPLFSDDIMLDKLIQKVKCRTATPSDVMKATGIPPHTFLLKQMTDMANQCKEIIPEIHSIIPKVIDGVIHELEIRAIGAGTVTRDGLEDTLMKVLEKSGLLNSKKIDPIDVEKTDSTRKDDDALKRYRLYLWDDGHFHRLPKDFRFTEGGLLQAWLMWCCGNPSMEIPPLRITEPVDYNGSNMRKRYSDYKYLMNFIEHEAKKSGQWSNNLNIEIANDLFRHFEQTQDISRFSEKGRSRRLEQMKWSTVVNVFRKKMRSNQGKNIN